MMSRICRVGNWKYFHLRSFVQRLAGVFRPLERPLAPSDCTGVSLRIRLTSHYDRYWVLGLPTDGPTEEMVLAVDVTCPSLSATGLYIKSRACQRRAGECIYATNIRISENLRGRFDKWVYYDCPPGPRYITLSVMISVRVQLFDYVIRLPWIASEFQITHGKMVYYLHCKRWYTVQKTHVKCNETL